MALKMMLSSVSQRRSDASGSPSAGVLLSGEENAAAAALEDEIGTLFSVRGLKKMIPKLKSSTTTSAMTTTTMAMTTMATNQDVLSCPVSPETSEFGVSMLNRIVDGLMMKKREAIHILEVHLIYVTRLVKLRSCTTADCLFAVKDSSLKGTKSTGLRHSVSKGLLFPFWAAAPIRNKVL